MPAIALLAKESLSWLIKVVTTPRNIEYNSEKNILSKSKLILKSISLNNGYQITIVEIN